MHYNLRAFEATPLGCIYATRPQSFSTGCSFYLLGRLCSCCTGFVLFLVEVTLAETAKTVVLKGTHGKVSLS